MAPLPDSQQELLGELDALHRTERETQTRVLLAATEFALSTDPVDPVTARLPGREKSVRLGGEGTPPVPEFAPALVGARLQLSSYAGSRLVADGLDLRFRLPRLHARLTALEIRVGHARYVARTTRHLSAQQALLVDERVAESADGRLPWSRFEALVEAAVIEADPAAQAEREREAAEREFATPTRSSEHGMRGFYVRAGIGTIAQLDATVARFAEALAALGDPGSEDSRRVRALRLLTNPAKAIATLHAWYDLRHGHVPAAGVHRLIPDDRTVLPTVQLHVHLTQRAAETGEGVARLEGAHPLSARWVRAALGERCRFTVRPVLDPLGQVPVDCWEVPERHRRAVRILTPADTFPYASSVSPAKQIDHTIPYDEHGPPGQSAVGNYGPMVTRHHRLKTHGGWQVGQPFPGIYVWRDPSGATFLVDHTGTRRVGATSAA